MDGDEKLISDMLRSSSRDLYLATLLVPETIRPLATALFAYHAELARIGQQVSEPMAGLIRLQWWTEVMEGARQSEAQAHPLARYLLQMNDDAHLATGFCAHMARAHEFDLFAEAMESRTMLEGYFGETRSVVFQMNAVALFGEDGSEADRTKLATASGHAGVSTGIVALLLDNPRRRNRGQIWVPQDFLRAAGLSDEIYLKGAVEEIRPALEALVELGFEHHAKTVKALAELPNAMRSIFSLCALTPAYLTQAQKLLKRGNENLQPLGQLRTQWLLYRAKF